MLYCVLGAGEMPPKELTASLNDLKKRCETDDVPLWFAVHGKAEPTSTDRAMMSWLHKHDTWYEVVTDDPSSIADIYGEAVKTHLAKRMAPAIVKLMKEGPEKGEETQLLALFASDDYSSPDDDWLNDVGRAVQDAGFVVKALNDGLIEMDFSDIPPPEVEEEEAAASPVADDEGSPDEEATAKPGEYTRDQLEEMSLDQLKEVATQRGVSLPPRTRIPTYINAILGEGVGEVEVELPPAIDALLEVEEEEEELEEKMAEVTSMSSAMLVVVYNGTVIARPITSEHALQLISQPV